MDLPPNAHMPSYYEARTHVSLCSDGDGYGRAPTVEEWRRWEHSLPESYRYQNSDCSDYLKAIQKKGSSLIHEPDKAQYGKSDFSNVVRVERGIEIEEAMQIAMDDPEIDYFFYTKGQTMMLLAPDHVIEDPFKLITYHYVPDYSSLTMAMKPYRVFQHGDAVFFHGEGMSLGKANGLADVFHKKMTKN